jgi:putative ABC transport system permease protein
MTYLKTHWRIIRTRKLFYFINVLGLALGIASSILIMLWIVDELSYEKMHEQSDQIMLLHKQYKMGDAMQVNRSLPMPLAPTLVSEFPDIRQAVRVVSQRVFVRNGETLYNENHTICAADPAYFEIFSFEFIEGDPASALKEPYSIVLTHGKAIKYFGETDPLGQVLELNGDQKYTVTGIIRDITGNTSLDFDMVIPFESVYKTGSDDDNWYNHFVDTYILWNGNTSLDSLNTRLTEHMRNYLTSDNSVELFACPIREMHLHDPGAQNPKAMYVYIFSVIGFLVLLIACINFVNVSTFVSLKRSREIGVKKINGGGRMKLVTQFFGETFYQTFLGFLLAMMFVELFRSQFNQLTGKSITIPYLEPWFILALAAVILVTTLLAGTYPALLISAYKPIDAFQGKIISGKGQARFRTLLVIFQFTISVGLIISTLIIYSQIKFIQNKNLGFDKENLVYLSLEDETQETFNVFREKLLAHSKIKGVCRSSSLPTAVWNIIRGLTWEGREEEDLTAFSFIAGDEDLLETLGLELVSGRNFSREFKADSNRVLVNEEASRLMGFEDPAGRAFIGDSSRTEIIGVFKDFHGLPLTERIEPMIMTPWEDYFNYILIRIQPGNPEATISHIEKVWKSMYPQIPFEFNFVDENIESQYRSEIRISKLSLAFTILAILITCIGLFAIAGHAVQKADREIGIRKAMGASGRSVFLRFVLIYLKWVLLANVIAWPLSWMLMRNWLTNFAYRTQLDMRVFIWSTLMSLFIAVLTVGWHAWNAANVNPVRVLKCE